jgi:hypothetical protein
MKHLPKLLLIMAAICLITACSKNNNSSSSPIIGKWTATVDTVKQYQNGIFSNVMYSQLTNSFWQFNTNGVVNTLSNGISDVIPDTYTIKADSLFIHVPAQTENGLSQPARTINWQIQTLTQHALILASTQDHNPPYKIVTLYYFVK